MRSLYPAAVRLHFVLDNFSPHKGEQVRDWANGNNVELAYTPHYASWLNRIEAQFKALRYFTLNGTDHPDHATQARLIRRYIAWRNRHADDPKLHAASSTRQTLPDGLRAQPRYLPFVGAATLARVSDEMFSVGAVLLVLERTGSASLAGLVVAAITLPPRHGAAAWRVARPDRRAPPADRPVARFGRCRRPAPDRGGAGAARG